MRDDWTETTIGDVAEASWGNTTVTKKQYRESGFTAFSASGPDGFVDWFEHDEKGVVLSAIGALCGKTWLAEGKWTPIKNTIWFKSKSRECLTDYLFLVSKTPDLWPIRGQAQPFISLGDVRLVEISMPPLAEQKRIVDVVSSVDSYIDALQQQADAARTARNAVLHELLSAGGDDFTETTLDDLVLSGVVSLGRGNVISKKDMEADPGPYPVYSSAQNNDGRIGTYNKFMFDEELITWSVDGGGHVFYRPHHKFSVTNIGGYLRILDSSKFLYPFLAAVLQKLHGQHVFDWQNKAHPSVIRKLYNSIPFAPLAEQERIVEIVSSMDDVIQSTEQAVVDAKNLRSGLLSDLLSGEHEIPKEYDRFMRAA